MNYITSTERLNLREFTLEDAKFIIKLLNTEGWIKYIGDRNIATAEDAKAYLSKGILKGYLEKGFGFYLVELKDNKTPIGMCGLIQRDSLPHTDIGFAYLPEFEGKGYAFEAANATMVLAKERFKLDTILAITLPSNERCISLLEKIGMKKIDTYIEPDTTEELFVFSN
jgi:[ribosomal protein S5]-alanine N-acetyltransferase